MKLCTCEAGLCCAMRDQAIRAREANDRREHTRRSCNTRRSAPRRQKRCPYLPMPTSQPNMPCHGYYTIRGGCVLCVPVRVLYFHIECAHFDMISRSRSVGVVGVVNRHVELDGTGSRLMVHYS